MKRFLTLAFLPLITLSLAAQETNTSKTLNEQLSTLQEQFSQSMPPETTKTFDQGVEDIRIAGITDHALKVGDKAELFELPDTEGEVIKLSDLLTKGPVVLVWYRGGWCPYCSMQLAAMQKALPEIQAQGATLIAISPQQLPSSLNTADKNSLSFDLLSDIDNKTARHYGLVYTLSPTVAEILKQHVDLVQINGNDRNELPLAATYVIDQTGAIRYTFLDPDYRKRAEPADIINALKQINTSKK